MYIHHIAINSTHPSDFVMERRHGLADYLFLNIKSACTFLIKDKMYTIIPPAVILMDSHVPHKYFPTGEQYCDDYLHFSMDHSRNFLNQLTFPLNTPIFLSQNSSINLILKTIEDEDIPESKYSDTITTLLIQLLFVKVTEQWDLLQNKHTENPHYSDLLAVRTLIQNTPERCFSIEELAEMAHLSSSYFQVMYKKTFGVTCINDVIDTKITQAKQLLVSTDLSVKQIASELGYNEVYHFIRQFKKYTSLTPLAFRKRCN